jgi:hypothetical protein
MKRLLLSFLIGAFALSALVSESYASSPTPVAAKHQKAKTKKKHQKPKKHAKHSRKSTRSHKPAPAAEATLPLVPASNTHLTV